MIPFNETSSAYYNIIGSPSQAYDESVRVNGLKEPRLWAHNNFMSFEYVVRADDGEVGKAFIINVSAIIVVS